jgi:hypothetical protein
MLGFPAHVSRHDSDRKRDDAHSDSGNAFFSTACEHDDTERDPRRTGAYQHRAQQLSAKAQQVFSAVNMGRGSVRESQGRTHVSLTEFQINN